MSGMWFSKGRKTRTAPSATPSSFPDMHIEWPYMPSLAAAAPNAERTWASFHRKNFIFFGKRQFPPWRGALIRPARMSARGGGSPDPTGIRANARRGGCVAHPVQMSDRRGGCVIRPASAIVPLPPGISPSQVRNLAGTNCRHQPFFVTCFSNMEFTYLAREFVRLWDEAISIS